MLGQRLKLGGERSSPRLSGLVVALVAVAASALTAGCGIAPPITSLHLSLPSEHYRLPNGLEVVLHRDASFDTAVVDVRYHVGSKDDPNGRSGFAHLHEHLTFRGGRRGAVESRTTLLEASDLVGWNATTNNDATEYFEILPPSQLPLALWLEATRMATPLEGVSEEMFARERDVVKNEYRQNYENRRYGLIDTFARAALFPLGHPYHLSTIGDPSELDRATLGEAREFARRFYTPRNATLVVSGDIDIEETRALVARHFGSLPPGAEPPAPRRFDLPAPAADRRIVVEADVPRPRLLVAWAIPPPYAKGSYETAVAANELDGILREELVTVRELADSVEHSVRWGRLGSMLTLSVTMKRGRDPEDALGTLESRLPLATSWFWRGWRPAFLRPRTEGWLMRTVSEMANLPERSARLQDFVEYVGSPDAADRELALVQDAKRGGAGVVAGTFLDAHKVIVLVKPVPGAPPAGRIVR